jgi:porin
MKLNHRLVTFGLVSVIIGGNSQAAAAEPEPDTNKSALMKFAEQDYMFGTWGGRRTWLREHGVDFEFVYFGMLPSNLSGGLKEGSVYEGALMMLLDLESEKLLGYEGGHLHAGGLSLHGGDDFSRNFVGDLNMVSLLDFPDTFRLWELWYEQKFLDNKVSLKFGQLAIDRDFIVTEYYNSLASINFLNQTFFYPTLAFNVYDIVGFPEGHHALASTPYGAPGVRLRVDPIPEFYVQAGVYDGNPDRTYTGTRVNLNDQEGALAYFEVGYRLNQRPESTGLPGNYKVGAYYHTDDFYDNESVFRSFLGLEAPKTHSGNYGVYLLADQMLYRERDAEDPAKQGLAGFFRVAAAPEDRNLTSFGIDGGLVYKGLIPTRDWDTIGVAASYLEISDDISEGQKFINSFFPRGFEPFTVADYEAVIEASYRAQITAWWTLQPDIQWVIHPGGSDAISDAVVFLVMTTLRF